MVKMMNRNSRYSGLIAFVFLFLFLPQSTGAAEPRVGTLKLKPYTLTDRKGKTVKGEIGTLHVPENRRSPKSRTIEIAFIRIKSARKNPRPPVFVLAGGPGGSGIAMAKRALQSDATEVLDYFGGDVIGVDQRGTGLSKPNLRTTVRYKIPVNEPGDPQKMLRIMSKTCRTVAAEWKRKGVDLTGYNTVESADDFNAIRKALGYKKINLWGGSYGSHLAFAIIRRHDKHLNRVVVQSPEGPNQSFKLPNQIHTGLERVSNLVAKDPDLGKKIPNLVGLLKTVLERLEQKPVVVEVNHPFAGSKVKVGISKFDVQMMVANAIGRVRTMRPVPKAVHAMSKGDFTALAKQLVMFRSFAGPRSAMSMMMDCASGATKDRLFRIRRESTKYLLGDAVNFPFPGICPAWGKPDLGDEFRGPLRSKVDILFIVGDLDSRTPIANAKALMKDLPNSHLIEVQNAAHDLSIFRSPVLRKAAKNFLDGKQMRVRRVNLPAPRFDAIDG